MTPPNNLNADTLIAVVEATWPPAARFARGAFIIREGQGGGKRVSAASLHDRDECSGDDIRQAETAMEALGQDRLFMLQPAHDRLDAALAARGYEIVDPVVIYIAPCADLLRPLPSMTAFPHWPPLAAVREIWAEAGINASRIAVMRRCKGAHTALLARMDDQCAGACFVAISGEVAMLHALEVATAFRRRGVGRNLLHAAANWALEQGATSLSLVVTRGNLPARQLYASLGMRAVGEYHYRYLAKASARQEFAADTAGEISGQ